jgi:hypothetical protein
MPSPPSRNDRLSLTATELSLTATELSLTATEWGVIVTERGHIVTERGRPGLLSSMRILQSRFIVMTRSQTDGHGRLLRARLLVSNLIHPPKRP